MKDFLQLKKKLMNQKQYQHLHLAPTNPKLVAKPVPNNLEHSNKVTFKKKKMRPLYYI